MVKQFHVEVRNPDWSIGGSATFDHDAAELFRRLNAHDELVKALREIADAKYGTDTPKLRARARAALVKLDA